jgi:phosphatidylinositol-bisphosphatase
MVLKKSFRVLRRYKPRSVLLESKEIEDEALLFESNTIASLTPAEAEMIRRDYGEAVAAYGCLGVLQIAQGDQTFHYLVLVTDCQSVGKVKDVEVFRITQTTFAPFSSRANLELPQEVGKLLASGQFYFAFPLYGAEFDLLACAQKQGQEQQHFFWNRALYAYMRRFGVDCRKWLVRVMCGSVDIQTVYAGDKQAKACLFSRLSCERAGTRLQTRGTDDNGHVGNFVETEQAIFVDSSVASFVQIRGGVPLFWEQPGLQTSGGMIKIKFSRGYVCSMPAFERHFDWCLVHYGPMLCVNLLGTRNQEQLLSKAYCDQFRQLSSAYCAEMVCFDYHKFCRGQSSQANLENIFLPMVSSFFSSHAFFVASDGQTLRSRGVAFILSCDKVCGVM